MSSVTAYRYLYLGLDKVKGHGVQIRFGNLEANRARSSQNLRALRPPFKKVSFFFGGGGGGEKTTGILLVGEKGKLKRKKF